jgi:hypothetical protein
MKTMKSMHPLFPLALVGLVIVLVVFGASRLAQTNPSAPGSGASKQVPLAGAAMNSPSPRAAINATDPTTDTIATDATSVGREGGASDAPSASAATGNWTLSGNAGISSSSNFLGTTDSQPLIFRTNNSERMRLDSSGKLGIGTTSPYADLHVVGTTGANTARIESKNTDGTWLNLSNGSTNGRFWSLISTGSANGEGAGSLLFREQTGNAVRMMLDSSGRLGLGTTSPTEQLSVQGNATISGDTTISGNVTINGSTTLNGETRFNLGNLDVDGIIDQVTMTGDVSVSNELNASSLSIGDGLTGNGPMTISSLTVDETLTVNGTGDTTVADDLGVGTTSPSADLHVVGANEAETARIESSNSGGTWLRLINTSTNGRHWSLISTGSSNSEGAGVLLFRDQSASAVRMRIDTSGRVGIGRGPTANLLEVEGNASKSTGGDWLANSDRRIKTDIQPLKDALDVINRLRPVRFRYTDEYRQAHPAIRNHEYLNFIAQEYQQVFPEAVQRSGESDLLQIDTHPAAIYAVAAIQELHQRFKPEEARQNLLAATRQTSAAELAALEAQNAALQQQYETRQHELTRLVVENQRLQAQHAAQGEQLQHLQARLKSLGQRLGVSAGGPTHESP